MDIAGRPPESEDGNSRPEPQLPENPAPQPYGLQEPPADAARQAEGWQPGYRPGPNPPRIYGPPVPGAVVVDGVVWLPAGFLPRLMAFLLDWALLGLLHLIIITVIAIPQPDQDEAMKISMEVMSQALKGTMPADKLMQQMDAMMAPANLSYGILIAMCAAYYIIFYTLLGATVGKLVLGLRVLRRSGQPIKAGTAALRYLLYYLTGWLAYTGWLTLLNAEKRTVHDMLSDTNVFKAVSVD
ncbi:RDD family protein [bacterium]|nr:RDD family protein [bacterium]